MRLFFQEKLLEVGCDEAGRGCLAGPVVAGAVILPKDFVNVELNDSKKLSEKTRDKLRIIIEKEAISWGIAFVFPNEIDEINILNASILAMHKAIKKLHVQPEFIAVDGNKFKPYKDLPYECCIKGDGNYLSIAAASILAKTHRDEYMVNLHNTFPEYKWNQNKGYPTKSHRNAITKYGATPYHRKSFRLLPEQLKLDI